MPHTTIVQVRQLIDCFYFIIFFRMIEPSRTDGNITFRCYPLITVGMPILAVLDIWDIPDIPRLPEGKTSW